MSHKFFFCLNLELLLAVVFLIWLADDLFMKALSLAFWLPNVTAHKIVIANK